MQNELTKILRDTLGTLAIVTDDKLLNSLHVDYSGKFNIDFIFTGVYRIHKELPEPKTLTLEELATILCIAFDSSNLVTAGYNRNNIEMVYTETCLSDKIFNNYNNKNTYRLTLPEDSNKVLVDFSSPNVAKDMHVGHLRSTIIGNTICNLYEQCSNAILNRVNHIGDFGLNFGMLVAYIQETQVENIDSLTISNLQTMYAASKKLFDTNKEFAVKSYEAVVKIQTGDSTTQEIWNNIKEISAIAYNKIYDLLGVTNYEVGESFYQSMIPSVVAELQDKGLLELDNGRYIMNFPQIDKCPLTVIKSDGSYTYDTTDLAAIRYRLVDLKMNKILYVVDSGQSTHFKKIFEAAKKAGWLTNQQVKHVNFGLICKKGGGKYATRDGDTDKLIDLLDIALSKSNKLYHDIETTDSTTKKNSVKSNMTDEEKDNVITKIAMGSVIYSDLKIMRTSDYVFDIDQMLLLKGNTCPYLLYSYVRACSIIRKANYSSNITSFSMSGETASCKILCSHLLQFDKVLEQAFEDLMLNNLCAYLYKLAELFNKFFSTSKCIEEGKINLNRLVLCYEVKRTMKTVFDLLGIKVLEKM
jgi:arginyl-tRNA synthetase